MVWAVANASPCARSPIHRCPPKHTLGLAYINSAPARSPPSYTHSPAVFSHVFKVRLLSLLLVQLRHRPRAAHRPPQPLLRPLHPAAGQEPRRRRTPPKLHVRTAGSRERSKGSSARAPSRAPRPLTPPICSCERFSPKRPRIRLLRISRQSYVFVFFCCPTPADTLCRQHSRHNTRPTR